MSQPMNPKLLKMDAAGLAIVVGLALVAYFGQIAPHISRFEQAKADSLELAQQQSKRRELERSLRSTADQLDAVVRAVAKAELKLEPVTELNRTLARLTELASANNLLVDSIESGATTQFDRFAATSIRIGLRPAPTEMFEASVTCTLPTK